MLLIKHDTINKQIIDQYTLDSILPFIKLVFNQLMVLTHDYPNFNRWLNQVVLPGLLKGERTILLNWKNGELAGIAILKHDGIENKICCLRVHPKYQNQGIGIGLFKRAMDILNTDKPLLTVTESRLFSFNKLFKYFDYKEAAKYPDYYIIGRTEISFNGELNTKNNRVK